jgi:hypothetical protein
MASVFDSIERHTSKDILELRKKGILDSADLDKLRRLQKQESWAKRRASRYRSGRFVNERLDPNPYFD